MPTAREHPGAAGGSLRVLVLGAGFGGLELASRLSEELGESVDVVVIDRAGDFVFGFSKLDVMFGRLAPDQVRHPYSDVVRPGVRFVQAEVEAIDPVRRRVETSAGVFEADVLVVALGADLDASATPGLLEDGHEFYTPDGAFAVRDVLRSFEGGNVVVGVASTPYKCPPAPSETVLLMHDFLEQRGMRDRSQITLVLPLPTPVPPAPDASRALMDAFVERGIGFRAGRFVRSLDASRHVAVLDDGDEVPYDLFLGVPVHRVPAVVERSGLATDGWIAVDPLTLRTEWPGVYAVGDVTSVGTPKAGFFAEGQALVVADEIIAEARQGAAPDGYDGRGVCYIEFGHDHVAAVDVTFAPGRAPTGRIDGPSEAVAAQKSEFGRSRLARWFGASSDPSRPAERLP